MGLPMEDSSSIEAVASVMRKLMIDMGHNSSGEFGWGGTSVKS